MTLFPWKTWFIAALLILSPCSGFGAEAISDDLPWKEFSARTGYFLSALDTTVRLGAGLGVDVDLEDALGLDTSSSVFRVGALWRFSSNRRHRLDLDWFSLNRNADRRISGDITIENYAGEAAVFEIGQNVESSFNLDIYQLSYSYSVFLDDRFDLAVSAGAYIMPISLSMSATGNLETRGAADFTAPLPMLGLRMDVALAPHWFIRNGFQVFYLEYETFSGRVLQIGTALEYDPWQHVGIGLGLDSFGMSMKADDEDWPGVGLNGKVVFYYTGLQLYLRCFF